MHTPNMKNVCVENYVTRERARILSRVYGPAARSFPEDYR